MIVHAEWSQQQEQQIDGKHVKNDIGLAIKIAKGLFYWIHLLPLSKIWLAEHDFPKKFVLQSVFITGEVISITQQI